MEAENVKNDLKLKIVKGNNNISELNSILIGEGLSKEMDLKVGDVLSLVSAENKELKLTVKGIFKTGFLDYDSNLVIIPLRTMQILGEQGGSGNRNRSHNRKSTKNRRSGSTGL